LLSTLRTVFTIIYLKQTTFLGYTRTNFVTIPVQSIFKNMTMLRNCKISCDTVADDNG